MSQNKSHNRDWWVSTVEKQRTSQLNLKEFSERIGVHPDTLGWWRRKLAKEVAGAPARSASTLVRVDIAPTEIAPVAQPARSRILEAAVGAVAIRFEVGTDSAYMAELLCNISRAVQSC